MSEKNKNENLEIEALEEEEELIVLLDQTTGEEVEFSLLAMLEVDGKTYAYLEPIEEVEDFEEGDLLITNVEFDENGEESHLPVTDDAELDKAFQAFDEMYVKQFGVHCDGTEA